MKLEKFKVIDSIRQFVVECTKRLENFPKKEIEISSRIKFNTYDMLEIGYYANSLEDIPEKIKQIQLLLAKARTIDFLLEVALDNNYITKKQYIKLADRLGDIEKFSTGWLEKIKTTGEMYLESQNKNIKKNEDTNSVKNKKQVKTD